MHLNTETAGFVKTITADMFMNDVYDKSVYKKIIRYIGNFIESTRSFVLSNCHQVFQVQLEKSSSLLITCRSNWLQTMEIFRCKICINTVSARRTEIENERERYTTMYKIARGANVKERGACV